MWKEMIFQQTVYYLQGKATRTKSIVLYHIHHCVALTAKSIHLKMRLLLLYSSIELQGKPICHVAFQIWAIGTGKRIHISAKIEPSPTYQNHSSCKKVSFFPHCLQLGRQLLLALAFATLLPCTALWTDLWVAAQEEIKQFSKDYTGR